VFSFGVCFVIRFKSDKERTIWMKVYIKVLSLTNRPEYAADLAVEKFRERDND
jgi:hypothetical protein